MYIIIININKDIDLDQEYQKAFYATLLGNKNIGHCVQCAVNKSKINYEVSFSKFDQE